MVRINIIVEGQTEEKFVKELIQSNLAAHEVYIIPRCIETSRNSKGKIYRGGVTTYEKIKNDILRWIKQDKGAYVTTMFDLYRLPSDFPEYDKISFIKDPIEKVTKIEQAFHNDINEKNFIPYIQLHEFEALLYCDVNKIDDILRLNHNSKSMNKQLQLIVNQFNSPEEINDNPDTAPSKRLLKLYSWYQKTTDGILIAKQIGIQNMTDQCKHFSAWLEKLKSLQK